MGRGYCEERKKGGGGKVKTTKVLSCHNCVIPYVELELKYRQKKVLKEITFHFPLSSFGSGYQRQLKLEDLEVMVSRAAGEGNWRSSSTKW